jgi:hypothetical protein
MQWRVSHLNRTLDSVVLAILVEKDGNLRVVYARIGNTAKVVLLGEVLKLRWRGRRNSRTARRAPRTRNTRAP